LDESRSPGEGYLYAKAPAAPWPQGREDSSGKEGSFFELGIGIFQAVKQNTEEKKEEKEYAL
jgi:hypothetical protein